MVDKVDISEYSIIFNFNFDFFVYIFKFTTLSYFKESGMRMYKKIVNLNKLVFIYISN